MARSPRQQRKSGSVTNTNRNADATIDGDNKSSGNSGKEKTESGDALAAIVVDPTSSDIGFSDPVNGPQTAEARTEPSTGETVEPPRRRPGRPAGSTNRPRVNVSGIERLLLGIHATLYATFRVDELQLSQQEAHEIADAYSDLASEYPLLNLDPKHAALVNFCGIVSIVYGSRFTAWKMRRGMNGPRVVPMRQQPVQPQQQPSNVTSPPPNEFAQMNGATIVQEQRREPLDPKLKVGHIAGVGDVVFPDDSDLIGGKKPN